MKVKGKAVAGVPGSPERLSGGGFLLWGSA